MDNPAGSPFSHPGLCPTKVGALAAADNADSLLADGALNDSAHDRAQ